MIRAFFRDSLIYTIPSLLSRGLSIFLVPLYTRALSPSDYGSFDMLIVFGALVNLTVALEISQGVARFYAAEKDENKKVQYASTSLWFSFICYSCFFILTVLFAPVLSPLIVGRADMVSVFRLGMAYISANGMFCLVQNQFRWELRSKQYAICSMLVTITTTSLVILLAYVLKWGLYGLLLGMLGGALLGCMYGINGLKGSYRWIFKGERLKEMLLFSLPLVPSGVAVFISNYVDRLMINHFLSLADLGVYGIGFRLSSVVGLVMVGFQSALTPLIYTNYHLSDTPRQIGVIFRSFLFFAFLMFFCLAGFSKEILRLFTTPKFYGAADVVVFLVPAVLLSSMYIFAPGIGIAKKTHLALLINLIGAMFNACSNYILIPTFGIQGAAIATMMGYVFVFFLYVILGQSLYPVIYDWFVVAKGLIATIVCLLLVYKLDFSVGESLLFKFSFIPLLAFFLVEFRLISKDEIVKAVHLFKSRG